MGGGQQTERQAIMQAGRHLGRQASCEGGRGKKRQGGGKGVSHAGSDQGGTFDGK